MTTRSARPQRKTSLLARQPEHNTSCGTDTRCCMTLALKSATTELDQARPSCSCTNQGSRSRGSALVVAMLRLAAAWNALAGSISWSFHAEPSVSFILLMNFSTDTCPNQHAINTQHNTQAHTLPSSLDANWRNFSIDVCGAYD